MILSRDQAQRITGDADRWLDALNNALIRWEITTPDRVAMFLAQCAHESGGFRRLVEDLHYSAAGLLRTWKNRFTPAEAMAFAYDEMRIAERAYGGRLGNGPEGSGDGFRFRGRGIVQLTGRANYLNVSEVLGLDFVAEPELLEKPDWAAQAAGWFWKAHGCNALADAGDFEGITRRVNGGLNNQDDRVAWLAKVRAILAPQSAPSALANELAKPQEAQMGALALFAPILSQLIPQIAGVLKPESPIAKRNVALGETIVNTIVSAAGASNLQDAVEKMQAPNTGPAVVETVKKALVTEPTIMSALQIVEVGGGAKAAADRDLAASQAEKPFWKTSAVFWVSVLLLPLVYWYVGSSVVGGVEITPDSPWYVQLLKLFGTGWSADARSGLANLVIGLVLGGICGVYYGISVTQQKQQPTTQKEA